MINNISILILPLMILAILTCGAIKKVPIYEEFVEGAKDGFKVSISILPYLVAIIVGVSMFKASGGFELISKMFNNICPPELITLVFTRPLSGSAALGIFSDITNSFGPDSYITKLSAILIGSSETTFYVLAVYFGSIGIKKLRYALLTGVLADIISIVLAIWVSRVFFLANS